VTPRARSLCLALAVAALALAAFAPVLENRFIDYDDDLYLTGSREVAQGLSAAGLRWAFTSFQGANWFPLTRLSWMLDAELFGLEPRAFHATSLLLHAAAAALLFRALEGLTGAAWRSALVAALFALHPLQVEPVAWASYRRDVLSGLGFALCLGLHARAVRRGGGLSRQGPTSAALALGLLAKPTLVSAPFVLLLLDLWPLRRLEAAAAAGSSRAAALARLALEKLPLFALAAGASAVTLLAQAAGGAVQSLTAFPLPQRLGNAPLATVAYLASWLAPSRLAPFYPHPGAALPAGRAAACAALLLALTALFLRERRRRPWLAVGWLWYLGMLVPVIGLVQVGAQARADRYLYLPQVGLSLALVFGVADLARGRPRARRALVLAALGWLTALGLATRAQVRLWRDTATLFEHALRVTDRNPIAHLNLAEEHLKQGRLEAAEGQARAALRLLPGDPFAEVVLAGVQEARGHPAEAARRYRRALAREPARSDWQAKLAGALRAAGDSEAALASFERSLALDPSAAPVRTNYGLLLLESGRTEEAVAALEAAIALAPELPQAHAFLGVALAQRGESEGAVSELRRALDLDPGLAVVHAHLARELGARGELDAALAEAEASLALDPAQPGVHALRADLLSRAGRPEEARAAAREALARAEAKGDAALTAQLREELARAEAGR
jgi:Tfp pilus assembly protein PilF